MKRILSIFLLSSVLLLLISSKTYAISTENPYSKFISDSYYEISSDYISGITDKLENLHGSGSVCIDYLAEEILLHRGILFTAHTIQSYTQNPELIDIIDDIMDNYSGELREMRIELTTLIDAANKNKDQFKVDTEYVKQYKTVINKLNKTLSQIKSKNNSELDYIKQTIALLEASKEISSINNECATSDLVKKIATNTIENSTNYISRLKALEKAFE